MEIIEVYEAVQAVKEVVDIINDNTDGQLIPQEVTDVLKTFGNSQTGDNDIEILLNDIKSSLMYDEKNTALYEISSRLEVIDTRLDKEFEVLNHCFGVVIVGLITIVSWKFFGWIMRLVSV